VMQLRLSVIPLMQGTPWMTTSYPSLDWSFLNSIVSPMLELSVKTARWLCLFMCMDWCQGCCCIGVHGKFSRRMNLPWQLTQPLFWFCPFLHVNQHLISPEKQLEHNYVKHVKQCLYVQWRTDHSEISRWASVENQINSKTHSVQHFQPPTMSISMSNKCGIQACPQSTVVSGLMPLLVGRLSQRPQNSAMVSEVFTNRYDWLCPHNSCPFH
jgi:hypothetical protein